MQTERSNDLLESEQSALYIKCFTEIRCYIYNWNFKCVHSKFCFPEFNMKSGKWILTFLEWNYWKSCCHIESMDTKISLLCSVVEHFSDKCQAWDWCQALQKEEITASLLPLFGHNYELSVHHKQLQVYVFLPRKFLDLFSFSLISFFFSFLRQDFSLSSDLSLCFLTPSVDWTWT